MNKVITDPKRIDEVLDRWTIVEILPTKEEFRNVLLSGKQLKFYIWFDATGKTLHLSHAKNFILLEKFRKLWHEVIVLFGDFTARIGDPTWNSTARNQLTREQVLDNVKSRQKLIKPLMNFNDEINPPLIKFNHEWLSKLTFEDIINLASNFTVQQMIKRDMYQKRLEENKPIYLHEFFYPLMQGYDSVAMDVDVEVCGTDQIFNALFGRTMLKKFKDKDKFVVAVTLMENPKTGELMSKSNGTWIFLDADPNDMYGQLMAQSDEMIKVLLTNCTHLSLERIDEIVKMDNPRDAKMILAYEVTKLIYKEDAATKAQEQFIHTIQNKELPSDIKEYHLKQDNILIVDLLVAVDFVESKWQAKKLLEQNAIKIDGNKISTNENISIDSKWFILQKWKFSFAKILK